ncbi:MAG: glycosyltransferase family 2 protein [Vicinamibacterales bacterium]
MTGPFDSATAASGADRPDVSVLIATRRRSGALARTLDGLASMDTGAISWELVVVDNDGSRETARVVREAAVQAPVTLLVEPVAGKNRALNRALDVARGALLAFTDDDVSVEPTWLREICEGAARWPGAVMFGGRILPRWPEGQEPPVFHPFFEHAYAIADFARPEGPYSSVNVYGPNMAVRSMVFKSGMRFDVNVGPNGTANYIPGSETSLTVTLQLAGQIAVYLPRALVHHEVRPEQLAPAWLYGRAFRRGRAEAVREVRAGRLRRAPRDKFLEAAREYAAWWRARWRRDRAAALDHGLEYWKARGFIHQWRVGQRPARVP